MNESAPQGEPTDQISRDLLRELIILRDQIQQFAVQFGEADFYTGGATEAIAKALPLFGGAHHAATQAAPSVAVPDGWKLVPLEPVEAQWGELARDIIMWLQMTEGAHHGSKLHQHLHRCGREIPDWLVKEIPDANSSPAKGTIAACVYKAMVLAATPPAQGLQAEGVPTVTLSETDAAFLAARLRRLFAHFEFHVPSFATSDGSVIRIAGSCIGGLLANLAAHPQQGLPAPQPSDEPT